jgi:RHS repeat-associated protein
VFQTITPTANNSTPTYTVSNYYDGNGNLLYTIDGLGRMTKNTYDALNRQTSSSTEVDPESEQSMNSVADWNTTTTSYYIDGTVNQITTASGQTSTFVYDALGHKTIDNESGSITETTYDLAGNAITVDDPDGNTTAYSYDHLGREIGDSVSNGADGTLADSYLYDAWGNQIESTDREGRTIQYTYDNLNDRTSESWWDTSDEEVYSASYTYSNAGEMLTASDPNSSYAMTYNAQRQVGSVSGSYPALVSSAFTLSSSYNLAGQRTNLTVGYGSQASAVSNSYGYNDQGLMSSVQQTEPDGQSSISVSMAYNDDGSLQSLSRSGSNAADQSYTWYSYYQDGRLKQMTNYAGSLQGTGANVSAYSWTYDLQGQVSDFKTFGSQGAQFDTGPISYDTQGQLNQTGVVYDANGNPIKTSTSGSGSQSSSEGSIAANNQICTFTDANGTVYQVTAYDAEGNWKTVVATNNTGAQIDNSDSGSFSSFQMAIPLPGGLAGGSAEQSGSSAWAEWSLAGTPVSAGQMIQIAVTWPKAPAGITFSQAAQYQLWNGNDLIASWTVDQNQTPGGYAANGVSWRVLGDVTAGAAWNNLRLRLVNNDAACDPGYGHDIVADGVRMNVASAIQNYQYDFHNRLTQVVTTYPGMSPSPTQEVDFVYDVFGRMISEKVLMTTSGVTTVVSATGYVYDGDDPIFQLDATGKIQRVNLYGPAVDQILAVENVQYNQYNQPQVQSPIWTFLDNQNTVRDAYQYQPASGTDKIISSYTYDPFGQLLSGSPSLGVAQYAGHPYDQYTQLYYARARFYSAAAQRFIQQDPIGLAGGTNSYAYCGNDPEDNTDPTGESATLVGAGIGAGTGFVVGVGSYLVNGWQTGDFSLSQFGNRAGAATLSGLMIGTGIGLAVDTLGISTIGPSGVGGLSGALIGAGVGGALNSGVFSTGGVSWSGWGKGAVVGGVAGGIGGAATVGIASVAGATYPGAFLAGSWGMMGGDAAGQLLSMGLGWQKGYNVAETSIAGATGGVLGVAARGVANVWSRFRAPGAVADDMAVAQMRVQARTADIRAQLGRAHDFGETYAVGAVRAQDGTIKYYVASKSPYGVASVNNSLQAGEELVGYGIKSDLHAEMLVERIANSRGETLLGIGATRPMCMTYKGVPWCQNYFDTIEVPVWTPRKQ